MSRISEEMLFEDLPYILQDEFGFAIEDCLVSGAGPEWNPNAIRRVFKDDGIGFASKPTNILKGNPYTFRVEIDGETFIWAYGTEQWCIVGDDL